MRWEGRVESGRISLPRSFHEWARKHDGARVVVQPATPPSRSLRGYFEGALVPAFCAWHEQLDPHNPKHRQWVREWLKVRFLGRPYRDPLTGETVIVPPSLSTLTAEEYRAFVESITDYYAHNGIPVPNPELFKRWAQVAVEGTETFWQFLERTGLSPDSFPPSEEELYELANPTEA